MQMVCERFHRSSFFNDHKKYQEKKELHKGIIYKKIW